MQPAIEVAIYVAISAASTISLPPLLAGRLSERGLTGEDKHRPGKILPTAGGIAIYIGLLPFFVIAGLSPTLKPQFMLMIFLVATLGFLLGLLDDVLILDKRTLVALSILIGAPVMTYRIGDTRITALGADLGPYFWIVAMLAVAYMSNAVNIYAGFNGMEAGCAAITSAGLAVSALIYGSYEAAAALAALSGALLGFLRYNFYPARIFIGNSGTYLAGALIAAAAVAGTIKAAALIATIPYTVNFLIRLMYRLRWTVGETLGEGLVVARRPEALWALLILDRPKGERRLVLEAYAIQAVFAVAAISYAIIS